MICYLKQEEKQKTRIVYEKNFPEDGKEFVDYYYKYKIEGNRILVDEREQKIQSMLHLNPLEMQCYGKKERLHYIVAVATNRKVRGQGKMAQLMKKALQDMATHKEAFTFLLPVNPSIYKSFGFFEIPVLSYIEGQKSLKKTAIHSAREEDWKKLAFLENKWIEKNADIFHLRNEAYYKRMKAELKAQNGQILVFKRDEKICGSCLYGISKEVVEVQELLLWDLEKQEAFSLLQEYFKNRKIHLVKMPYMVRILDLECFVQQLSVPKKKVLRVSVKDEIISKNNGCYEILLLPEGGKIKEISLSEVEMDMDVSELTEELLKTTKFYMREWV